MVPANFNNVITLIPKTVQVRIPINQNWEYDDAATAVPILCSKMPMFKFVSNEGSVNLLFSMTLSFRDL